MSSIEEQIRLHGQKKELSQLQELIENLETDVLQQLVLKKIHNPSFISFFNYLLEGFKNTPEEHDKRFNVVTHVIKCSQVKTMSTMQLKYIVTRLCAELHKFKSHHLIELVKIFMEYIQKGNPDEQSWNDMLPFLLHIINEYEHVEYNGDEISGFDYNKTIIQSLLMMEWSPNIITSLTNMFITMTLTKEEHLQVVNKLGQAMEKLIPQEMPLFIYQFLKLCKHQNGCSIFLRLQNYFGLRIYCKDNFHNEQDSENIDMIVDASDMYVLQAESTVLFHINECAVRGEESINDYLSSLKKLIKSPEFILHPFHMTVLLTISTVNTCEERAFDILKATLTRSYAEENKKKESCWFKEMVPSTQDISKVFFQLINISLQERILVMQGLINFCFILLNSSSAFGKEAIAEKMWDLGKLIILKLIKRKRSIAHVIIQRLVNHITTEQNVHQHIDCLHTLSKRYGLVLLENQSIIINLMERSIQIPKQQPDEILEALIPFTTISFTLRDHLILLLNKGLSSRSLYTRQMAIVGFIKIIKKLKFSNTEALSQSSTSSMSEPSVMSQISLTRSGQSYTFTNEALCLEVLSILRRCFIAQATVKYTLYEELADAIPANPDLAIPILDMMWSHFSQFYVMDDDARVPFHINKLFQTNEMDVIILEPLAKLLYSIGVILNHEMEHNDPKPVVERFANAFEKFSEKMGQCELEYMQMDDGTDLLDVLPESQQKLLLLQQTISIYEALIGYNLLSWYGSSKNKAKLILNLFKAYTRFIQFGKTISKPKKDEKNKTMQKSQNDTTRCEGTSSNRHFKALPTVLDFQCVDKMLQLLYTTSIPWTSMDEANVLRKNVPFNRYVLQTTIAILLKAKQLKYLMETNRATYYKYCKSIATILYNRCITRFNEFSDFDTVTACLSVEAFYVLMQLINSQFKEKWSSFLSHTTTECNDEVNLNECLDVYKKLFNNLDDSTPQDSETQKHYQIIIQSIEILSEQISPNSKNPALLEWLTKMLKEKQIKSKQVSNLFVEFTFDMHRRFKTTSTLFKNVALNLSNILGTVSEQPVDNFEEAAMVSVANSGNVLSSLCTVVKEMLDSVDWIIMRLTSEFVMVTYPGEECVERRRERIKAKERSVCFQLCQIISIMTVISDISIDPGNNTESVLKISIHLFQTLTNLTKHFIVRSNKVNVAFQQARLESVVKQVGKKLSPAMYTYILFIERNQKQPEGQTQKESKKKVNTNKLKSEILKHTRLIPKLIYEMELFSKTIVQLSNKTKVQELEKYVGQGTSRDFRILQSEAAEKDTSKNNETADDSTLDEDGNDSSSDTEQIEEPVKKKSKK